MRGAILSLVLLVAQAVAAQEVAPSPEASPSPDAQADTAARQYYDLGAEAYEKGDYPAALRAFEAAWSEAPHAEFQFNIARCHERLGQWDEAAGAYQQYLRTKVNPPDALEMRARIAELRLRAGDTAHPVAATTAAPAGRERGLRVGALSTLGAALVLGGAGAGAYFSAWSEFDSKRSSCQARCTPASLDGLRTRVEIAQVGGAVLFSLAGVALVTDVALWVLSVKARRP